MEGRIRLLVSEFLTYALTVALGVAAAWANVTGEVQALFAPVEATGENLLVFAAVFIAFTVLVVKFVRPGRISLKVTMVIAVFIGAEYVFASLIGGDSHIPPVLATVGLLLLVRIVPIVLTHNLSIAFGIAGIGVVLGLGITAPVAALLLALLSIYDIIAVYRTGHMIAVAERMMTSGAVFGFLVPANLRGYLMPWRQALDERRVLMLGSGDVGLPLILVVAAVQQSLAAAIFTACAALIGLMLTHWLFMSQRERIPMAALPPVAAMTVLGYLLAFLLGL